MNQLKKGLSLAITLALMAQCLIMSGVAAGEAQLTVLAPTATQQPGNEFEVGVLLDNNPGIVIFSIMMEYDNARFEYLSITKGPAVGTQSLEAADDVFDGVQAVRVTNGLRMTPFTTNGVLYTLKFKVKDDAPEGAADFTLSYREGDVVGEPIQPGNLPNNLDILTVAASVTVGLALVTGRVRSYNPQAETEVELYNTGTNILVASTKIEALLTGSGLDTREFYLYNVPAGVYDLVVVKQAHLSYTIVGLTVGANDLNMTIDPDANINMITLPCGDINSDGMINDSDLTVLWTPGNYNRRANNAVDPICDLNGDGMINDVDLTILWLLNNYNRGPVVYKIGD